MFRKKLTDRQYIDRAPDISVTYDILRTMYMTHFISACQFHDNHWE